MKKFLCLMFFIFLLASPSFAQDQHQLFTGILKDHVKDGVVDYRSLCEDARFTKYMDQLINTNTDNLGSDKEKLAFWINVYNAWTLKIICDNYPVKSINDLHSGGLAIGMILKTTVWDKKLVTINNKKTSLSDIEHKILRPVFKDPRIHFAIVCAAKGCPPLRNEAYEADRLDRQLDEQGRLFLAQENKNSFMFDKRIAYISPVFGWFKEDFGKKPKAVLRFIARYLPKEKGNLLSQDTERWKIKYTNYDWSLNE
ncbi:MAG: DUF547 domain-containing protein [Candidatus Omnitrophota bacterium]|nr:MAG: DUF547 domain-containing protein [Candidatus Omnitrophota bacterium]